MKIQHIAALAMLLASAVFLRAQNLEEPLAHPNPPLPYTAQVDSQLPEYHPVKGLSGTLKGVESNTVTQLMQMWIDDFTRIYPAVKISVDIGGSGQGGPRLTSGIADFAFIAREMMGREETPFVEKFGYKPLAVAVAGGSLRTKAFTDAIVFIVHKDNPLNQITFQQLDAIYSSTHNRGIREPITTWGQLGLTGDWANKPIHLWGVEIPNGYDNFVNQRVLANGQWRDGIGAPHTVLPLSDIVAADKYALSYTGLAWNDNPKTKVLKLSATAGPPFHEANFDEVAAQTYPLSRVIYIFANRVPDKSLNPVLEEFLKFALSRQGQQDVVKDAIYTPLPAALDAKEAAKLK
ncbi:MAG: substrate-binding domain-containing protein [Acidobacteriota bacterium]|nr:substrate-binding domain-containing protein [Acidobacteriota bacterium]